MIALLAILAVVTFKSTIEIIEFYLGHVEAALALPEEASEGCIKCGRKESAGTHWQCSWCHSFNKSSQQLPEPPKETL